MAPLRVPMLEKYGGRVPRTMKEATAWYRKVALSAHPDKGGTTQEFQGLENEYEQCKAYFKVYVQKDQPATQDKFAEAFTEAMQQFKRELEKFKRELEQDRMRRAQEQMHRYHEVT